MKNTEDCAKIHYMSEITIKVTPLHILEGRRKMEELRLQMEANIKFMEELAEEGLLKTYLETKYGSKTKERDVKIYSAKARRKGGFFGFGMFALMFNMFR